MLEALLWNKHSVDRKRVLRDGVERNVNVAMLIGKVNDIHKLTRLLQRLFIYKQNKT